MSDVKSDRIKLIYISIPTFLQNNHTIFKIQIPCILIKTHILTKILKQTIFYNQFCHKKMIEEEMQEQQQHAQTFSKTQQDFNSNNSDKEDIYNFDQTAILDRYHQLHHDQYRQLTHLNLSQTLKQKLWGFSTGTLLYNQYNSDDLVIQNHPLKGRILMTKDKYAINMRTKKRQINIKSSVANLKQDYSSQANSIMYQNHRISGITDKIINPELEFEHLDNVNESRQSQTRLIRQQPQQM